MAGLLNKHLASEEKLSFEQKLAMVKAIMNL